MHSNINYQQFNGHDARRESTFKLLPGLQSGDSSDKHWASGPLITLSVFQMAFGVIIIILQSLLDDQYFKYIKESDGKVVMEYYGIVCGAIILVVGILSTCTASLKSRCLSVFATLLYFAGYVASIVCCAASIIIYNHVNGDLLLKGASIVDKAIKSQTSMSLDIANTIDTIKIEFLVMAALAGINFILSIVTSGLICRGCCTCCHSRSSSPMYMVRTDLSSPAVEIQGL